MSYGNYSFDAKIKESIRGYHLKDLYDLSVIEFMMRDIYNRYNSELGHTFNQEMTGHENINDYVSVTEYADGTRVYVNYGYTDYAGDGINVPARDYKVVK